MPTKILIDEHDEKHSYHFDDSDPVIGDIYIDLEAKTTVYGLNVIDSEGILEEFKRLKPTGRFKRVIKPTMKHIECERCCGTGLNADNYSDALYRPACPDCAGTGYIGVEDSSVHTADMEHELRTMIEKIESFTKVPEGVQFYVNPRQVQSSELMKECVQEIRSRLPYLDQPNTISNYVSSLELLALKILAASATNSDE